MLEGINFNKRLGFYGSPNAVFANDGYFEELKFFASDSRILNIICVQFHDEYFRVYITWHRWRPSKYIFRSPAGIQSTGKYSNFDSNRVFDTDGYF